MRSEYEIILPREIMELHAEEIPRALGGGDTITGHGTVEGKRRFPSAGAGSTDGFNAGAGLGEDLATQRCPRVGLPVKQPAMEKKMVMKSLPTKCLCFCFNEMKAYHLIGIACARAELWPMRECLHLFFRE